MVKELHKEFVARLCMDLVKDRSKFKGGKAATNKYSQTKITVITNSRI